MDAPLATWFRLSPVRTAAGVFCGREGVFVGDVPLLERIRGSSGVLQWQPRALPDLSSDLSKRFALPVEFAEKMSGLSATARALDRGDIALARIATLHLRIPDPPHLAKSARSRSDIDNLAQRLRRGGLLKGDWDPAKHPRRPAGSPGGIGGEFALVGSDTSNSAPNDFGEDDPSVVPAQATVPAPFDMPFPSELPLYRPFEFIPPPLDIPNDQQRDFPKPYNPYPNSRKCVQEWEAAHEFCDAQEEAGKFKSGYRGFGADYYKCLLGQISEECGGNMTGA